MTTEFNREERYIVFKLSDVEEHFTPGEKQQLARLVEVQRVGREEAGKAPLECVVVESDWPEYEPTWNVIEARMTGAQPAPSDEYVGWYCAHCERGVDASEVTYHEQHTVCGRVITDDKPPKPAPSVPDFSNTKDAARYRWLRENGLANEKRESRAVLPRGGKKASMAFRYWTAPEELDMTIDAMIAAAPEAKP